MSLDLKVLQQRYEEKLQYEKNYAAKGFQSIAGVDEAGRGPVAGPLFAAAVILDPEKPIWGLDDSKKLTPQKRLLLEKEILQHARAYAVVSCSAFEIDQEGIGILNKKLLIRAIRALPIQSDFVLADFFQLQEEAQLPWVGLIQGDGKSNSIAAASILAKVARDRFMENADHLYPGYGFAQHKGYGTRAHREALLQKGLCPEHRRSFLRKWGFGEKD